MSQFISCPFCGSSDTEPTLPSNGASWKCNQCRGSFFPNGKGGGAASIVKVEHSIAPEKEYKRVELVKIQASEYHSISVEDVTFEGTSKPVVSVQASGESSAFHFDNDEEARIFFRRALEAVEARW